VTAIGIDSLNGYTAAMPDEQALVLHMHELLQFLNRQGATTFLTVAQHGLVGEMRSPVDVTYLADSVVLLRYFEAFGRVRRAVSVLKKRTGAHEDTIREVPHRPGRLPPGRAPRQLPGRAARRAHLTGEGPELLADEAPGRREVGRRDPGRLPLMPLRPERALILAPRGRDAVLAGAMLAEAGLDPVCCADPPSLLHALEEGAGLAVVTEEAFRDADLAPLSAWIEAQPEWSDFPFVLLTDRAGGLERNPAASRWLALLGNVSLLERPFHPTSLVSLARAALRGRRRQYEARARLEALRESEDHYRHAVELNPQVAWTATPDGLLDHVGSRWMEWTGTTGLGATWGDAMHPDDLAPSGAAWAHALATGEPYDVEHRMRMRDGTYRAIHSRAFPRRDGAGRIVKWYGTTEDVEARSQASALLQAETRALETLNATGTTIAADLDLERIVQTLTDAGTSLVGAAYGAFFHNVLDETGERLWLYSLSGASRSDFEGFGGVRATRLFGPTFRNEGPVRAHDVLADARYGSIGPHHGMPAGHLPVRSYLAVPVVSRSGAVLGGLLFGHPEPGRFTERHERLLVGLVAQAAVAIDNARLFAEAQAANEMLESRVADRTAELIEAQAALQQAQKMEAIGHLTGGIAHDFNNLLQGVAGSLDLIRRKPEDTARVLRWAEAGLQAAERGAKLTGQLLAFSRAQRIEAIPVVPSDLVRGMRDLLERTLGPLVRVSLDLDADGATVLSDPTQLEMAVLNLAINARDAMPDGGSLRLITRPVTLRADPELPPGDYVELAVADSGTGMPADVAARAFDPFFTTKGVGKGTGLGLSQVYGIARQGGGVARIDTRAGGGTVVRVLLRRTEARAAAAAPSPEASPRGAARDDPGGGRRHGRAPLPRRVLGDAGLRGPGGLRRARGAPDLPRDLPRPHAARLRHARHDGGRGRAGGARGAPRPARGLRHGLLGHRRHRGPPRAGRPGPAQALPPGRARRGPVPGPRGPSGLTPLDAFAPEADARAFRSALGAFATGVTVVTTRGAEGPGGHHGQQLRLRVARPRPRALVPRPRLAPLRRLRGGRGLRGPRPRARPAGRLRRLHPLGRGVRGRSLRGGARGAAPHRGLPRAAPLPTPRRHGRRRPRHRAGSRVGGRPRAGRAPRLSGRPLRRAHPDPGGAPGAGRRHR
jgi:PAS domain S-box-containing protein